MVKKKKVWKILDLFSGTQSVLKALEILAEKYGIEFEYIGIDIYSPEGKNLILDLSEDNIVEKLIALLPDGWIPDFIWASPVCSRFSIATAVRGGNVFFERIRTGIKVREDLHPLQDRQFKNYTLKYIQGEANLHLMLVENMQKILDFYDVDFVIENPRSSYMVHVLNCLYVPNKVDYCMYGFKIKKPTTIYSNYNLDLKTCNHTSHEETFQVHSKKNTADRAKVPPELIGDILKIFLLGGVS